MKIWALLAAALLTAPAFALVDMKTANYSDTWLDLSAPGTGYNLRVQRTYNSRTIYSGIFGFGWCSDFETRLEVTPEGALKIVECGAGAEVLYTPKKFDAAKVNNTVGSIMAEVKKRNPGRSEKFYTDLQNDLKSDDFFREEFARKINLKGSVDKDTTFYANGRDNETLMKQNDGYKRVLADGTYMTFTQTGKLSALYDKNNNYLKLVYDKDQLIAVVDNAARRLNFTYNPKTKKVKRITGPNNSKADYETAGEDLKLVVTDKKDKYAYEYDDLHNLTKITLPDGKTKSLTYNQDKDWVTGFKDTSGCLESYEYKVSSEDPKNHYWSTVTKKCNDKVTAKNTYEFFHRTRSDGLGVFLYRVKSDVNNSTTDITYHEVYGKPVSVLRGGQHTEYTYFDTGLVKTKKEEQRLINFEYKGACNKVSKVLVDFYDPSTLRAKEPKILKRTSTQFAYDSKRCNLVHAENTEGQNIKMQYDMQGRMTVIEDQSKRVVKISYDDRFASQPKVVTRPGLGAVRIKYNDDGGFASVDSDEGPRVAVQIITAFNNYLEIISPAAGETNL